MLGSDLAVEGRRIVLLPETVITAAVTEVTTTPLVGAGIRSIAAQCLFSYGSGGTGAGFYLQTSFDKGTTWTDIAAFRFPGVEGRLATEFDGTNDWYERGSDLTGNADSKVGTVSGWIRIDGGDDTVRRWLFADGAGFSFAINDANELAMWGVNAASATILNFQSTGTYTAGPSYHHFLASWDLATTTIYVYIDGVADTGSTSTLADDTIDYTRPDWDVGGQQSGAGAIYKHEGAISELYFDPTTYMDLSVESNRRKFISASGLPVPLGADGSLPTGNQPILYLPDGDASDNKGSGGDFTAVGSPTSIPGPNTEASRFQVMKSFIPVAANQSVQDGALTANTILDGVLGDRFRIKYSTTGVFAGDTTIKIDATVKA